MPVGDGVYLIVGTHCRTSPYVQLSPGIPAVWIVTWVNVQGLTTTTVSDLLATAIRAHLAGPNPLALVCITPTQLTWLARKTASKGCVATPASKMSVNVAAPIFNPACSFAEDVQFVHYFRIDVPSRVVIKDAPTGKYVTIYGNGYNALNV